MSFVADRSWRLTLFCLLLVGASVGRADDAYYRAPVHELELSAGKFPPPAPTGERVWHRGLLLNHQVFVAPYVVLDGPGEAFVRTPGAVPTIWTEWNSWVLVAKAPAGRPISGRIFFCDAAGDPAEPLRFRLEAERASPEHRAAYLDGRYARYDFLANRGATGAAWFRHEALRTYAELHATAPNLAARPAPERFAPQSLDRSLDLFTGQRAISENLALERGAEAATFEGRPTIAVDGLAGITVAEIDWTEKLPRERPTLDPLARSLPADQHAVFFPSFAALVRFVDHLERLDATLLAAFAPASGDRRVLDRYQAQLGVSLDAAARLAGGALVRSVAITGGDPYLATGADVTLVFESERPELLGAALFASLEAAAKGNARAEAKEGEIGGTKYRGYASDDRRTSGYVATLGGAVVVTNSIGQLERLERVRAGGAKSLAELDEFVVFRDRYRVGADDEMAFVFLSDATIRRWCGPRWRIGAMRRARALAELAELQAGFARELVEEKAESRELPAPKTSIALGDVRLAPRGVVSSTYNTLEFATPIGELPLDLVTSFEVEAYNRWRTNYEQQWRWAFDPIGVRISLKGDRLAGDMTILPLVAATQYRDLIDLTRGARIPEGAGDRHGALAHFVVGLNRESRPFKMLDDFARGSLKSAPPADWLGATAALYLDDSPLWREMQERQATLKSAEFEQWCRANAHRVPLALRFDVRDVEQARRFLKDLRAHVAPLANTYVTFEEREHRGRRYVRAASTPALDKILVDRLALHFVTLDDSLVVSFAEETAHRAIDRELDGKGKSDGKDDRAEGQAPRNGGDRLAGGNAGLELDGRTLLWSSRFGSWSAIPEAQRTSWANVFILNEWKRLFPDRDPSDVHQRLWGVRLACPAGGEYRWNDDLKSYESSVAGHPMLARRLAYQPDAPPPFNVGSLNLLFEGQGLRVRATLDGVRK